ncbi:MAG: DUF3298 domain-containing protein [Bacteroidales bacterium]|nr:DUF3298 domain-containing protein [Bacteroidales bacterium]
MKNTVLVFAAAVLVTAACGRGAGQMTLKTYEAADSTEFASFSLTVELPAGKSNVETAIRSELLEVLDGELAYVFSYEGERRFPRFDDGGAGVVAENKPVAENTVVAENKPVETSWQDTERRLEYYSAKAAATVNADAEQAAQEMKEYFDGPIPEWSYELKITRTGETDRYIVFNSVSWQYTGGAHGGIAGEGAITFSKKDGSRVRQMLLPGSEDAMQPLLVKGLLSYYAEMEVQMSEQELKDNLFIEDGRIPLPTMTPFPTPEGMVFVYAQYEIASYADGMPAFVLPFDELQPFLTPEAKALL